MDKKRILIQLEVEVPYSFSKILEENLDNAIAEYFELIDSKEYIEVRDENHGYIGVIKFKSDLPYEYVKGFKFNTNTSNIDKAKEILNNLCSTLSISNDCQVRWEFEGIGQGHYHDDYYWKKIKEEKLCHTNN